MKKVCICSCFLSNSSNDLIGVDGGVRRNGSGSRTLDGGRYSTLSSFGVGKQVIGESVSMNSNGESDSWRKAVQRNKSSNHWVQH